jgi:hypothetical protein
MEDLLDRFTDPVRKQKKRKKKEEHRQAKRRKVFLDGKQFARDKWLEPPSLAERQQWLKHFQKPCTPPLIPPIGSEEEQNDMDWLADAMNMELTVSTDPFQCIADFANMVTRCNQWLQEHLKELGWSRNETGYQPVEAAYSVAELLHATWQCYHMAVKQASFLTQSDG